MPFCKASQLQGLPDEKIFGFPEPGQPMMLNPARGDCIKMYKPPFAYRVRRGKSVVLDLIKEELLTAEPDSIRFASLNFENTSKAQPH